VELTVHRLGRVEYGDGLALQKAFGEARATGVGSDSLLLLEHPPVLTLGRGATGQNVLASPQTLASLGVELFETSRGGDVTYHGPGQIVGYPILQLPPDRHDVRRYVRDLEEVIIRALKDFGIAATRIPKWTGVWIGDEHHSGARKVAAIGVHQSRWRTSHGFALNVNTNLSHFGLIVPCGIREKGVTSMQKELGGEVDVQEVEEALIHHFGQVFEARLTNGPGPALRTVSVGVVRHGAAGVEALVLLRREDQGGFWQPVTGTLEPGEAAETAARREVLEETSAPLKTWALGYRHTFCLGGKVPPVLVEEAAFWAQADPTVQVRHAPDEHVEHAWLPVEEAVSRVPHAGLKRVIREAAVRISLTEK
jgi:lipoyl(octanoyl) transferase